VSFVYHRSMTDQMQDDVDLCCYETLDEPGAAKTTDEIVPAATLSFVPRPVSARNLDSENDPGLCTCSKTHCLKAYCICFKSGNMCSDACACQGCANNYVHNDQRNAAVLDALNRDPMFFYAPSDRDVSCACKLNGCDSRYCVCYANGGTCSDACACTSCINTSSINTSSNGTGTGKDKAKAKARGKGKKVQVSRRLLKYQNHMVWIAKKQTLAMTLAAEASNQAVACIRTGDVIDAAIRGLLDLLQSYLIIETRHKKNTSYTSVRANSAHTQKRRDSFETTALTVLGASLRRIEQLNRTSF